MNRLHWTLATAAALMAACGTSDAVTGDTGVVPDTTIGDSGDVGGDTGSGADAGTDVDEGTPCIDNLDCRGGEVCRDGLCREACSDTDPCSGDLPVCDEATSTCVECVVDADCAEGTCVDNACFVDRCTSDLDCPAGLGCDLETGTCGLCATDGDCPGGYTCVAETCTPIDDLVCVPDARRCEGQDLLVCSRDGTLEERTTCDGETLCIQSETSAACMPIVCTPDEIGCLDGSTAYICDPTGTARTPLECRDDQYCDGGSCRPKVCDAGVTACEGDALVECDGLGAAETVTPCAGFEECAGNPLGCACVEAECLPRACLPSTGRCVGANVQRCADDGLSYLTPVACDASELCVSGQCVPATCTVGQTLCTGDTLLRCEAGGRWVSTNCATTAQLCTTSGGSSTCSARICEPLAAFCANIRTIGTCDARGAVLTEFACEDGTFCIGSSCTDSPCDPRTCAEYGLGEERPDTDLDGIVDCTEGIGDPDGDRVASCVDDDADGDLVSDLAEGVAQTDGDGVPDYLDRDSDGDGIGDLVEGERSSDGDGVPDRRDPDSDNDTITDAVEAGRSGDVDAPAVDSDLDGFADYIDPDSDNDGLLDTSERGCPASTSRTSADSDSDSWSDSLELELGSDACAAGETPEDLVDAIWRPTAVGATTSITITHVAQAVDRDVVFNIDTTGSMGSELSAVTSTFGNVTDSVLAETPGARFGIATYEDYACGAFGSAGDLPFLLVQRVTSSVATASAAISSVTLGSGADIDESGYEALYQIATGVGLTGSGTCAAVSVPAFNPSAGRVAGVADGTVGGVGFRGTAMPVVLTVTDAPSHQGAVVGSFAATSTGAISALNSIGARAAGVVINIGTSFSTARTQLRDVATATGATVPTCAWGATGARPSGCAVGTCCTGSGGIGEAASAGTCPLVFELPLSATASQIETAVTSAFSLLARYGRYDVRASVEGDPGELAATGFDTSSMVVQLSGGTPLAPAGSCGVVPLARDTDANGLVDTFEDAAFGATLPWTLVMSYRPSPGASGNPYLITVVLSGEAEIEVDRLQVLVIPP